MCPDCPFLYAVSQKRTGGANELMFSRVAAAFHISAELPSTSRHLRIAAFQTVIGVDEGTFRLQLAWMLKQ
jgi:hypothetical protein